MFRKYICLPYINDSTLKFCLEQFCIDYCTVLLYRKRLLHRYMYLDTHLLLHESVLSSFQDVSSTFIDRLCALEESRDLLFDKGSGLMAYRYH